jgi:hypothetical protein
MAETRLEVVHTCHSLRILESVFLKPSKTVVKTLNGAAKKSDFQKWPVASRSLDLLIDAKTEPPENGSSSWSGCSDSGFSSISILEKWLHQLGSTPAFRPKIQYSLNSNGLPVGTFG